MNIEREYSRGDDIGPEGQILFSLGDKLEREIANIKDWMKDIDRKVDSLIANGCAHRGNDLEKLIRIEKAAIVLTTETSAIKDSIHGLALSFERQKVDLVNASKITDSKITNLKMGILAQCVILLVALLAFVSREFIIPATKNVSASYGVGEVRSEPAHVDVPPDVWRKIMDDLKDKKN
jgi:hypothetical protein